MLFAAALACGGTRASGEGGEGEATGDSGADEVGEEEESGGEEVAMARWVAAGSSHSCAILEDGGARCWGLNMSGALGNGASAVGCDVRSAVCAGAPDCCVGDDEPLSEVSPIQLAAAPREIHASSGFACALLEGGAVQCWGSDWAGRLGVLATEPIGDDEHPSELVQLGGRATMLSVSHGRPPGQHFDDDLHNRHVCALLEDATLRCWGIGTIGALGYGTVEDIGDDETPESVGAVPVGAPVRTVVVGGGFSCAVLEDGALKCWGFNGSGELGHGIVGQNCLGWRPVECNEGCCMGHETPVAELPQVPLAESVQRIVAGPRHVCVQTAATTVRCWGQGWTEPGQSAAESPKLTFEEEVTLLDAGFDDFCVTTAAGRLICREPSGDAQVLEFGAPVTMLSSALSHRCALLDDGTVRCWGYNSRAQLGYPIDPSCYQGDEPEESESFDCEHAPSCCLGDDEPPTDAPAVPL